MSNTSIDGPRGCTRAERHEAVALSNAIHRPGGTQDLAIDYPLVYRENNLENLRICFLIKQVFGNSPGSSTASRHAKYVTFQMAEVAVPCRRYRAILERIRRLAAVSPRATPI